MSSYGGLTPFPFGGLNVIFRADSPSPWHLRRGTSFFSNGRPRSPRLTPVRHSRARPQRSHVGGGHREYRRTFAHPPGDGSASSDSASCWRTLSAPSESRAMVVIANE